MTSNYVSGKASGKRYIGGLVGSNIGGTITQSYWDKTASKLESDTGGVGLLASEMQSANAQDEDLKKPYYKWSTAHWDFGTAEQYPILKYATGSDLNNPVCGPEQTLPNCGALLLGQHASLKHILFLSDVDLSPNFKPTELNYQIGITTGTKTLQLIPIASNPDSSINISRNGIVIDSDLANGTTSSVIILGENTEIVIEVSAANQRPAQYSLTTHYLREITILGIPDKAIDEGESIILDASQNLATADTLMSYRWTQSRGKTLFPSPDSEGAILWLHIPEDYVPATEEHATLGLTLEINNGKAIIIKNITLTIAKVDNGNIPVAPPTLTILEGTAPEIDLGKDPDGSGKDFSYQWQSRAPGQDTEWIDINEATEKTHIISFFTESYTEYRVLINYTDRQGYKTLAASKAARYVPEIMILDSIKGLASEETIPADAKPQRTSHSTTTTAFVCSTANIDQDDDGLIEICDLEGLNAIRYVRDGSGYRANRAGCHRDGCKGYELMRDLDFNDDASYRSRPNKAWTTGKGWVPIGHYSSNSSPFTAIFEGNGHTISNLMINRYSTDRVGLFGYTEGVTIKNVVLSNINIKGGRHVGGLVGWNSSGGTITNSYATGAVKGDWNVGGLVGSSRGTITNSYATGAVKGDWNVGGLVGSSRGTITNSYATGAVEGRRDCVGGLVGYSSSSNITSSYAMSKVSGNRHVGGLIGSISDGTITNSYATGAVGGNSSYVGGLIGSIYDGTITNSYATGAVEGNDRVGGLVGHSYSGKITNSYAAGAVEGNDRVGGLVGYRQYGTITNSGRKPMAALQGPTSAIGIYAQWSTANWDFGTSNQYPVLKYAKGDGNNPACSDQAGTDLPVCGSLLPSVLRGLSELRLVKGNLSPSFIVTRQNYVGTVVNSTSTIQFKPTAIYPNAKIFISADERAGSEEIDSGATSDEIMLKPSSTTKIIIGVKYEGIVQAEYTLYLDYYYFNGDVDMDDNGLIEINSLEKLNAMRYQLDGTGYRDSEEAHKIAIGCPGNKCKGYELKENLDFNDAASYRDGNVNEDWTMSNRGGWQPIGDYEDYTKSNPFTAIFEGHGYTISNLMINKPDTDHVGLFGYIERGTINNVGLSNIDIKGGNKVGGLGGSSRDSDITNSYAIGDVEGNIHTGGLVGINNNGTITNSYVAGNTTGTGTVGGLVGDNSSSTIRDSYATNVVVANRYVGGLVGWNWSSRIENSYATGFVSGNSDVGGLFGDSTGGTITASYWDKTTSRIMSSAGGIGKTTTELQSPTTSGSTSTEIYYGWSAADWHFGTSNQYPALKYAVGPDTDNPACGSVCGTLLHGQRPPVWLEQLTISTGTLSPLFGPQRLDYDVTVKHNIDDITLNTTATGAEISIASNTAGTEVNTMDHSSVTIPLTITGDTIITITVSKDGVEQIYTVKVRHNLYDPNNYDPSKLPKIEIGFTEIDEGEDFIAGVENPSSDDEYMWEQISLPTSDTFIEGKTYPIPTDFVEAEQNTRELKLTLAVRNDHGLDQEEDIELTVVKDNNGAAVIVAKLEGSQLSATITTDDPDGMPPVDELSYQWQQQINDEWHSIARANAESYTIPTGTTDTTRYRVKVSYTDGQGYPETVSSEEVIYRDIDVDDDGLIEISTLEELDAIRNNLAGTSYKTDEEEITAGCPVDGCKGYELAADLDFQDAASYSSTSNKVIWTTGEGWKPIGSDIEFLSGIFKGNNHTISNLMINRESADNVGLFSRIRNGTKIDEVHLYNIEIVGHDNVGGLVGANSGGLITLSSVSGGSIEGKGDSIGGLAGLNSGSVSRSYASVNVSGTNPDMGRNVGGLVGDNIGQITDSYAAGKVDNSTIKIGGLVGENQGSIKRSYARGIVQKTIGAGSLIGLDIGTITHSYWDKTTNGRERSTDDMGKTTEQLQSPTTATGIYSSWSEEIWDFGTNKQYPALKNNDGTLLAGQRLGLQSLELSDKAILGEVFNNTTYSYIMFVAHGAETIQTTPTTADPNAEITLSTSNDSNETTQESGHHQINLAEDTSTVTIVVKANNREVTYTFAVKRVKPQITEQIENVTTVITEKTLNEGDEIDLKANTTIPNDVPFQVKWVWMQIDRLLATTAIQRIQFPIPANYIVGTTSSSTVTLKVTGIFTRGDEELRSSAEVELTINKKDNDHITGLLKAPRLEEATEQIGLHLVAPGPLDYVSPTTKTDPDNGINADKITYQWQSLPPGSNSWSNIDGNEKTYKISPASPFNTQYRVKLGYTDGQGHPRGIEDGEDRLVSQAITVKHVDRDNNGLIDIFSAEALAAIRHQLDGSGYKKSSTATEIITEGCPMNNEQQRQCNGYELKAHIGLTTTDTTNWEPIGNANNPFNTIFNGNHYTISNLTIDSPDSDNVGLFGITTRTAEIRNVGLLSVTKIAGRNNVGGLIGSNQGKVVGSYVIVAKRKGRNIYGGNNVGGLIGSNQGKVVGSYVIAVKGDGTNIYGTNNVGGLVGFNSNTTITESYAIVKKIVGDTDSTGGLVGKTSGGEISNSYATVNYMKVRGVDICPRGSLIGKLVGTNDADNPSAIIESKMAGDCGSSPLFD